MVTAPVLCPHAQVPRRRVKLAKLCACAWPMICTCICVHVHVHGPWSAYAYMCMRMALGLGAHGHMQMDMHTYAYADHGHMQMGMHTCARAYACPCLWQLTACGGIIRRVSMRRQSKPQKNGMVRTCVGSQAGARVRLRSSQSPRRTAWCEAAHKGQAWEVACHAKSSPVQSSPVQSSQVELTHVTSSLAKSGQVKSRRTPFARSGPPYQ